MKLNYMTLMVRDVQQSAEFYQNLAGLQEMNRLDLEQGSIRFLGNAKGETMLELIEFQDGEKVEAKGMVLSFLAEVDLEALRKRALELGYHPSEIIAQGPKPRHFTVLDPDRLTVEFTSFS
mgnify:CR=1 FL=1